MRSFSSSALAVGAAAALTSLSGATHAFSTRVHIAIANDVRESLIASSDGRTIALKSSPHAAVLADADARAIVTQPLAFRAGAVGPDNMAFPAMTDPSHALYQRPYLQCEVLYRIAANDEERAYALGCFLHGTTDAVAHHYVNYVSGETFTMTPLRTSRARAWDNVVRHIIAEGMIQKALVAKRPAAFTQGQLAHTIPLAFVARAYLSEQSELYPIFAGHPRAAVEARMKAKQESFLAAAASAELTPADHLSLAPLYVKHADALRDATRRDVADVVARLQDRKTQDGATLGVTAGPDGKLGTRDDKTACAASCPALYARYFVSVALLAPREDAGGKALPSAFDKVSEKMGQDLAEFIPAYLATVSRVSSGFNTPLAPGQGEALDLGANDVTALFRPMTQWSERLTAIDYRSLSQAVAPGWILAIESALQAVGVTVSVPDVMAALLSPIVQPVKDLIRERIVDAVKAELGALTAAYAAQFDATKSEYVQRLAGAAAKDLDGGLLGHFAESGVYVHAFNFAAATLAQRELVLPAEPGDPVGVGPASFDTSYTVHWSQPGVCAYLRDAVFPFGMGARGLLTVQGGGATYPARVTDDSPVECHDGALDRFASAPSEATCGLTHLPELLTRKTGSLSRGFPPALARAAPACRDLVVPGLPAPPPPPVPDGGISDGGISDGGIWDGAGSADPRAVDGGGCDTARAGGQGAHALAVLAILLGLSMQRRRRAR